MMKRAIAVVAMLGAGVACAFAPQTGTWAVTAESNGQPGRGFGLDVQGNTLVMQMYAYDQSGNPTFYLSAGKIRDNQYSGKLNQYRDGRYFGSSSRTGKETGSAGEVSMRFESGTKGFIKFPNEPEKEISRYSFTYGSNPESLRGIWIFNGVNKTTAAMQSDLVLLNEIAGKTENGSGMVSTPDRLFACENMIRGELAGFVLCVKLNVRGQIQRGYFFQYSVNDGEGVSGPESDYFKEWLIARRITTADLEGTGMLLKSQPEPAADVAVKLEHLLEAMTQYAGQVQNQNQD